MEKYLGCSGYHYRDWKDKFYPANIPQKQWLRYYAEYFNTVEINSTFYRTPAEKTFAKWYDETPDKFRFTVKGSRYITHLKKLKDTGGYVKDFYRSVEQLQQKLICVLWQLPRNQKKDLDKLDKFCQSLSPEFDNVMEFRDLTWFDEDVYDLLKRHNVTLCILSAPDGLPETDKATTDAAYVRFHGKTRWYNYNYSEKEIKDWSNRINQLGVKRVYAYFNNDYYAYGPYNCLKLQEYL
ncbi:MAG: DUF72 domain-containing protein [Bacteroidales bacterium]|nr:DUF72 domain-containing protein [Bacteroidales bacterium]